MDNLPYSCRICFEDSDIRNEFIVPCDCAGTAKYVHKTCLNEWLKRGAAGSNYERCNSCLGSYERKKDDDTSIEDKIKDKISNELGKYIAIIAFSLIFIALLIFVFPIIGFFVIAIVYWLIYTIALIGQNDFFILICLVIFYIVFQSFRVDKVKEKSCFSLLVVFLLLTAGFSEYYYEKRGKELRSSYRLNTVSYMYDKELKTYVPGIV